MSTETETKLGDVDFAGKDIAISNMKFNKIAVSTRGELLLLSLIAETHKIKQVRAILSGGAKATITAGGVEVNKPNKEYYYARQPGRLHASAEGYHCYVHKLGYGQAHALFLTKTPGFMKVVTPQSLWNELNSTRFTTPILHEWVDYIEKRLRSKGYLEDADVYGCKCGLLSATTKSLDDIVTEGLRNYEIMIPKTASV